ncbi:MAG: DUF2325 domain-containing protein [Thermodesulfobacteriota bacterium]
MIQQTKKIWHIDNQYHCSIIGTCLTDQELQRLVPKTRVAIPAPGSDYELHSAFVALAGENSRESLVLHKFLDQKYRLALSRFAKAKDDPALETLWKTAVAEHEIKGAYWALMTHPKASKALIRSAYGDVHMLHHKGIGVILHAEKETKELRERLSVLEEVLGNERRQHLEAANEAAFEIAALRMQLTDAMTIAGEADRLRAIVAGRRNGAEEESQRQEHQQLQEALAEEKARAVGWQQKCDRLGRKLAEMQELQETTKEIIARLQGQCAALTREKQEREQEMISLESVLHAHQSAACGQCEDCNTSQCPGPVLCGKTVLYVGGMHNLIPHYKKLVEQSGAEFMHHDGGREDSRGLLDKLLSRADAVLCPVDCVSHDACLRVKKMCKRQQKPFVMMRGSGLSALAKGLNEIVQ